MGQVVCTIDGVQIRVREGMTILQAAEIIGLRIPTLCYSPDLKPIGACRVCLVEVEGSPTLPAACHTPVSMGMVIHTRSPKVVETRRTVMELLLSAYGGPGRTDPEAEPTALHRLLVELGIQPPPMKAEDHKGYRLQEDNPYLKRDLSKCILCRRCLSACDEIAGKKALSVAYRGFQSKIIVDLNGPWGKAVCKDCGICIPFCPTGALQAGY